MHPKQDKFFIVIKQITKLAKYVIVLYQYVNIRNSPCTRVKIVRTIKILRRIAAFYVGGETDLSMTYDFKIKIKDSYINIIQRIIIQILSLIFMNKDNSVRVSFAGLKNERNKQNELTFQNLKSASPSHSFHQKNNYQSNHQAYKNCPSFQFYSPHSSQYSKNTCSVNTKNNELRLQCSTSTKFANTIREKNINCPNTSPYHSPTGLKQAVPSSSNSITKIRTNSTISNFNRNPQVFQRLLQQSFNQVQKAIKLQIEQYNAKYTEVTEILADLHIKDLMKFNEMLQKNQIIYQEYKYKYQELQYNFQDQPSQYESGICAANFYQLSFEDSKKIYQVERALIKIISDRAKSFDFRSTYQSKNKKTISAESSRVSPQVVKEESFQQYNVKKNLQRQKLTDSITYQIEQNSRQSRHSKFSSLCSNQELNLKKSQKNPCEKIPKLHRKQSQNLQDTPESVKSKISFTTKIKTQKDVIIGMFDRINVCQSIQQLVHSPFETDCNMEVKGKGKARKDYRYGRSSQE